MCVASLKRTSYRSKSKQYHSDEERQLLLEQTSKRADRQIERRPFEIRSNWRPCIVIVTHLTYRPQGDVKRLHKDNWFVINNLQKYRHPFVRDEFIYEIFVCLFSRLYKPLWLYFHSPVAGFSLLVFEVS
jgi:hypothetical protein